MKAEMAKGAASLHSMSIRLMTVFRCVRSYGADCVGLKEGGASVGIQSRSMQSMLVIRESFSTIPSMRATAKRRCLPVGTRDDRMKNHIRQQTTTVVRFVKMVS